MYAKDDKPFIIGITGNIATGKSVILRMLANTGALAIDADLLAHRMLYPGGPAYQPVIDAFGLDILTDDQMISNQKLGQIVFHDPKRLRQLEALVHPPVINAIHKRVQAAKTPIVAIEAIKLLESGLADYCDQVWVSHASYDHQVQRLLNSRGLTEEQARTRIKLQPPQASKLSRADVIISTEGSFKDTWERTQKALNDTIQVSNKDAPAHINNSPDNIAKTVNSFSVAQLESSWQVLSNTSVTTLYVNLGSKKVILIVKEETILAFVIWDNWNFTATLEKVYPPGYFQDAPELAFDAYEKHARIAQSEILLVSETVRENINPAHFPLEFTQHLPDSLFYPAWKTAANKAASNNKSHIWMKVLTEPYEILGEPIIE
jgi:dephospho-CoA kinase